MKVYEKRREPKLNPHDLIDRLGATLGGIVYRKDRLFGKSLESPPLREAVPETHTRAAAFDTGVWQQVTAKGPAGSLDAAYLVYRWQGFNVPSLLYIHGSGEQPHKFSRFSDNSFQKIFARDDKHEMNLILLMAPFHEGSQGEYIKKLGYLNNYVGMLATTTALLDALANRLQKEGCPAVYAAGFSLGGWVLNLHRAFYGTGINLYVPMCAGTKPSAVFVSSHYRKLTAAKALQHSELLEELLDFHKEFSANKTKDCYPLLFRYDRLIELKTQAQAYEGMELKIIDKGHFTGQQAAGAMREHILRSICLL